MLSKFTYLYLIIFSIPLLLFGFELNYLIFFALSLVFLFSNKKHYFNDVFFQVRMSHLVISLITSFIISYAVLNAISISDYTDRAELREGVTNYNETSKSFLSGVLEYFRVILSIILFSKFFHSGNLKFSFIAGIISAWILFTTGTRWLFLLSMSPVAVLFLYRIRYIHFILIAPILFLISSLFAVLRSSGSRLEIYSALYWDLPSIQSFNIVTNYDYKITGFIDFINGNILVLIPRIVWPGKPADQILESYMRNEIGSRYDHGATILPGMLGSLYLYGGALFLIVFLYIFKRILSHYERQFHKGSSVYSTAVSSAFIIGLFLQLRGLSVFYLMPALFIVSYFLILKIFASDK